MSDREKVYYANGVKFTKRQMVTKGIEQCLMTYKHDGYETQCYDCPYFVPDSSVTVDECRAELRKDALALLKEQDELLKHEYWRGYNNGRADERGLQEGTIMQTFSPD